MQHPPTRYAVAHAGDWHSQSLAAARLWCAYSCLPQNPERGGSAENQRTPGSPVANCGRRIRLGANSLGPPPLTAVIQVSKPAEARVAQAVAYQERKASLSCHARSSSAKAAAHSARLYSSSADRSSWSRKKRCRYPSNACLPSAVFAQRPRTLLTAVHLRWGARYRGASAG